MPILIHTSGRADMALQHTARSIPPFFKSQTYLVVQSQEAKQYRPIAVELQLGILVLPARIKQLSPTRQYLVERFANTREPKIILIDDDLTFAVRPKYSINYVAASHNSVADMFHWLYHQLEKYTHAGIAAREGANRIVTNYTNNTRMMRVLAYDTRQVMKVKARFDRVPIKQDFDMTLQLLRAGHANIVSYQWCHNQRGSGAAGGCSVYRTEEMQRLVSEHLAELHPGFVKVVQKETKTAWGGGVRTDVQMQWKKAYESSHPADRRPQL